MNGKFDMVVIKRPDGGEEKLTAEAFAKVPLTERVHLVSRGYAKFFKNGNPVSAVEALRK